MKRLMFLASALVCFAFSAAAAAAQPWSDPSPHKEGFVTTNGVKLEYLDWGGQGPALILIHGGGDNPHVYDDLAPAFTARHRVIAYARRGHGRSEAKQPYDTATLAEDLRGLMDALRIEKADLVGWSLGSHEITGMAGQYPQRVGRLIYLDGAYDWEEFIGEYMRFRATIPAPASSMASLDAYRAYEKSVNYALLGDMQRVEAQLREGITVQPDGSLKSKVQQDVIDALVTVTIPERLEYVRVRAPVLAVYAESFFDLHTPDPKRREAVSEWEREFMAPLREKSIARARKEFSSVDIVKLPGAHGNFVLMSRAQLVEVMGRFLGDTAASK